MKFSLSPLSSIELALFIVPILFGRKKPERIDAVSRWVPKTSRETQLGLRAGDERLAHRVTSRWGSLATQAHVEHPTVPVPLLLALLHTESRGNPNARNLLTGGVGLLSISPARQQAFGIMDPLDPAESMDGGAAILAQLLPRYGGSIPYAVSAYRGQVQDVDRRYRSAAPRLSTRDIAYAERLGRLMRLYGESL